jgi:hypothetical protein
MSDRLDVEMDEPEAWLESMRRIADRRAEELETGLGLWPEERLAAARWRNLASALRKTQDALEGASKAEPKPEPAS